MTNWAFMMDQILQLAQTQLGGKVTTYQRPGFASFSITAIPEFLDRLEDPSRGQFYSLFFRCLDFDNAPFSASVTATFTANPNGNETITFAGITYTAVISLDNTVPYQFLRGSSAIAAASNLANAINADPSVSGTLFSSATTPHPTCTASWLEDGHGDGILVVSAITPGMAQNALTASEVMSNVSLDSKDFYGGGPLVNDFVTVDDTVFLVSDVPEPDPEGGLQVRLVKRIT